MSRAISNLGAHTSVTLLHRSTRHVVLAEEARDYFALCVDVLDRLHDGERRLIGERSKPGGLLGPGANSGNIRENLF